jgi:hypothetical protein
VMRQSGHKREAGQLERRAENIRQLNHSGSAVPGEVSAAELLAENNGNRRK